jgi:plasmid stabilization system protein ParE
MRINLSDDAERDLERGYLFYEKQGNGLGDYFLDTLHSEIESLLLYSGVHRRIHGLHRLVVQSFPFAVYYDVSGELVLIWAVLDCRSDPSKIRPILRNRKKKNDC